MKPGRELDALVAEKVMKIRTPRLDVCWTDTETGAINIQVRYGYKDAVKFAEEVNGKILNYRAYSTDIAAAWEVFEKCTLLGSVFKLETPLWGCGSAPGNIVTGESAPHAICLAALAAVGALPTKS